MAITRKTPAKPGKVTNFPAPTTAAAVAEEPETPFDPPEPPTQAAAPAQQPDQPFKRGRGHPKRNDPPVETDFWKRVREVPRADWGSRTFLYLYILEPLCNLRQSGGRVYLNRYAEPVQDEQQICNEYGSGRYRLLLAYNKVSPDQSNELARHEFEIYNPQYPPKVPRAAWVNDQRNHKWEALLPKEPTPGAQAQSTIVDAMKMVTDLRRDIRDEIGQPEEPNSRTYEVLETMKAAKELFSQPANTTNAPVQDPLQIAVKLAETMMQMKADNPVIDMYREELKAMREELKEAHAKAQTAAAPKSFLQELTEFASMSEKLEPLKKLFGINGANGDVRPRGRTTALDVVETVVGKVFDSPLAEGLGQWLAARAQTSVNPAGAAPIITATAQPAAPGNGPDAFQVFIRDTLNPSLMRHFVQGFSGETFAGWLYDSFPDRLTQLQNFKHPLIPLLRGAPAIIQAYKATPSMWPALSSRGEPAFAQFVNEFCQWKPADEVQDAEIVEEEDAKIIDLDNDQEARPS